MYLGRAILRVFGYTFVENLPPERKFLVCAAWHTSNWDFPLAVLIAMSSGISFKYIVKRELTDSKLGWLYKRMGMIGIDRTPGTGVVEQAAQRFKEADDFILVVAAEGTRSKTSEWGTGFYYIALAADVPIVFGMVDSVTKRTGLDGYFYPTGDREADLQQIKNYYQDLRGLKPSNQTEIAFREPKKKDIKDLKSKIEDQKV